MIIFARYNALKDFESAGILDQFSFAAFGQANTVCSKAPNLPNKVNITFLFSCSENYQISEVLSSGILSFDPDKKIDKNNSLTEV